MNSIKKEKDYHKYRIDTYVSEKSSKRVDIVSGTESLN